MTALFVGTANHRFWGIDQSILWMIKL